MFLTRNQRIARTQRGQDKSDANSSDAKSDAKRRNAALYPRGSTTSPEANANYSCYYYSSSCNSLPTYYQLFPSNPRPWWVHCSSETLQLPLFPSSSLSAPPFQSPPSVQMHRIHSTAKVHALEKSPTQTGSPHNIPSPTLTKPVSQYAAPKTSSRSAASYPPTGKQPDVAYNPASNGKDGADHTSTSSPPDPASAEDTKEKQSDDSPIEPSEKPSWPSRMKAGSSRFLTHTKNALLHSWVNVLLVFVPVGIAVNFAPLPDDIRPTVVFSMNAVAIIPLAGLLSHATESVASRMGDTMASLLNVTFGNAVELIIFIIALAKGEIRIVQASILGSILANLLLILGMAFLLGGLRFQEQIYNNTVTQMSACLLSLSVTSLLLPTAFHASFRNSGPADDRTVKISRGTSIILLIVYVLYLLFQLKSHAYMYESTPQQVIDEESYPGVLADMMNSSDESFSSTSSSDGSSESENTAKRIKKAWRNRRRRKSTANSTQTPSVPSILSSPSHGIESTGPPSESYFDPPEQPPTRSSQGPGVLSGDEADTDGENGPSATRIRDFEAEKPWKKAKKSSKKFRKSKRKHKEEAQDSLPDNDVAAQSQGIIAPRVDFVDEPEEQEETATPAGKKPFAKLPLSNFKPPNVFANTVFTNPPPARAPGLRYQQFVGYPVRSPSDLRRVSSLPDRLMSQPQRFVTRQQLMPNHAATEPARGPDGQPPTPPKESVDEEIHPQMSRTAAVMLLLVSTGLVAFCAELLVDVIPQMIKGTGVSQAFIGLIVLPIVGNAAEHVTAVTVATKNKMDLAIGVSVGSSIQIALFITPVVVIIGWIMDKDMTLYFNLFETVSLFVTAFVVNFLVLDGRSNYLEGSLLIAAYVIIAVAAFFYPNSAGQSAVGGGGGGSGY